MVKDRQAQTESPSLIYGQERMLDCYSSFLVHMTSIWIHKRSLSFRDAMQNVELYILSLRASYATVYGYHYSLGRKMGEKLRLRAALVVLCSDAPDLAFMRFWAGYASISSNWIRITPSCRTRFKKLLQLDVRHHLCCLLHVNIPVDMACATTFALQVAVHQRRVWSIVESCSSQIQLLGHPF